MDLLMVWLVLTVISVTILFLAVCFLIVYTDRKQRNHYQSNFHKLFGKSGRVTALVPDTGNGYVYVEGEQWLARSVSSKLSLKIGMQVEVVNVVGCHVVVRMVQPERGES
jgi:membrane protein implicated in regulation of membrane protease activity